MTLIVSCVTKDGITVSGDMHITDPDLLRKGHLRITLKTIVLRPDFVVSYAGSTGHALKSIREAAAALDQGQTYDMIESMLAGAPCCISGDVEFLIGAGLGAEAWISQIVGGAPVRQGRTYIGDPAAYNVFQKVAAATPRINVHGQAPMPPADLEAMTERIRVMRGLEAAVDDPAIASVDGHVVSVLEDRDGLNYAPSGGMTGPGKISGTGWQPIQFGNASDGAYHYSLMPPTQAGHPCLAIYFPAGRCGVLYQPLRSIDGRLFSDVGATEFKASIEDATTLEFLGSMIG